MEKEIDYSDLLDDGFKEISIHVPPGTEHYCFACSPTNPIGLKLRFFGNKKTGELVSKFIIHKEFCGFPKYSHGGILTTLVDELMAHVTQFKFGRYGITKSINVKFIRPVLIDKQIFISSKVEKSTKGKSGEEITVSAKIYDCSNSSRKICVVSEGVLVLLHDDRFKILYEK